jgi:hypothetical protein
MYYHGYHCYHCFFAVYKISYPNSENHDNYDNTCPERLVQSEAEASRRNDNLSIVSSPSRFSKYFTPKTLRIDFSVNLFKIAITRLCG